MSDILLIEPNYKNKYPPLGLMKIAYFHKYFHNDFVRFAKGRLPEEFDDKKWDRVYVTTLFTFEWEETKKIDRICIKGCKGQTSGLYWRNYVHINAGTFCRKLPHGKKQYWSFRQKRYSWVRT